MILEKPARPSVLIEIIGTVPTSTNSRLAAVVHGAPSLLVEKDALARVRFKRKEISQDGDPCLRVSGTFFIGEEDAHK